jgi:hypothetical protein
MLANTLLYDKFPPLPIALNHCSENYLGPYNSQDLSRTSLNSELLSNLFSYNLLRWWYKRSRNHAHGFHQIETDRHRSGWAQIRHIMLKLNEIQVHVKLQSWICNTIVPRVPNENAEKSLQVMWQHRDIGITEGYTKQFIHIVRGTVLPIC